MHGFKKFLLRGNVIDLAVAVVIGAAFTAVVNAFVTAFITPLVGLFAGASGDFKDKGFVVGGDDGLVAAADAAEGTTEAAAQAGTTGGEDAAAAVEGVVFPYGQFVDAALSFVIVAAVVYFLVVMPSQRLLDRFKTEPEPADPVKTCPECLSKIPEAARRCAFCSVEQPPVTATA